MLHLGRCLGSVVALAIALAPELKAAGICPPRISAYDKCPGTSKQSWPAPPLPSYIDTDTVVVERPDEGVWEYHWCLKSSTPVEDFFFIWPDVGWPGGDTSCGGFWGGNLTSPYPPIVLQSSASIGPDLWPIQPQIKKPARYPPTQFWHKVLEYVSEFFASLHLDKEGKDVVTVEITVRSTATPIIANDEHIATEYQVAYSSRYEIASSSSLSTGVSPIRFSFSHNLVGQAFELDGEFSLDEPRPVKFTKVGPPTNIIGAIVFVAPDGYEVGSMPISLAVPSE